MKINILEGNPTAQIEDRVNYIIQVSDSIQSTGSILASMIQAEGDLIVGLAAASVARLPIGAVGDILMVNPAVAGKLEYTDTDDFMMKSDTGVFNIRDYGGTGEGLIDDLVSFNSAIAAIGLAGGSGVLYVPAGVYYISGVINVTEGVVIRGDGVDATIIGQVDGVHDLFYFTEQYSGIEKLSISGVYGGAGPCIHINGASNFYFRDLRITGTGDGIVIENCSIVNGSNFKIGYYSNTGLTCKNSALDVRIQNFLITATDGALVGTGTSGGIYLKDFVDAFYCSNGAVLLGDYGLKTDATTYAAGSRPGNSFFNNVFFDSQVKNPLYLEHFAGVRFSNCFMSGGRTVGAYASGVYINHCEVIEFSGCNISNSGLHGAYVSALAKRITFDACFAINNNVGAGAGNGIHFENSCTDFSVINSACYNGLYPAYGTQVYGIYIGTTCTDYNISNNNLTDNATAPIYNGSPTEAERSIAGNMPVSINTYADTSTKGLVELATDAETITGTDTARAVTPAGLQAKVSSATVKGIVELAIVSEINTGTDTERAVTPDALAGSNLGIKILQQTFVAPTVNNVTGYAGYFVIPPAFAGMNLIFVHARVITAGITSYQSMQVVNITDTQYMLSTAMTIEDGEVGTDTSADPGVINGALDDVAAYDLIGISVDSVHTTPAKGLIVTLGFQLP